MEKIVTADFEEKVLASEIPVLVDFYADWCGPCKMMSPIVERVAEKYAGKVAVFKCNVDEEPALAAKYGVMSIPTMIIYNKGEVKETTVGAMSQANLEAKLDTI